MCADIVEATIDAAREILSSKSTCLNSLAKALLELKTMAAR